MPFPRINEFVLNHDGTDSNEFIETGDVAALIEDQGSSTVIRFDVETSITLSHVDVGALLAQPQVFILV